MIAFYSGNGRFQESTPHALLLLDSSVMERGTSRCIQLIEHACNATQRDTMDAMMTFECRCRRAGQSFSRESDRSFRAGKTLAPDVVGRCGTLSGGSFLYFD